MVDSEVAQPQPATAVAHGEVLTLGRLIGLELAIVEGLGYKGADRRMQTVGSLQEEAVSGRHRRLILDDVVQNRLIDALRVNSVRGLPDLVPIAQHYKVVATAP